jgi:hypothetical protein
MTALTPEQIKPVAYQFAIRQETEDGWAITGWAYCDLHDYRALMIPKRALYDEATVKTLQSRIEALEAELEALSVTHILLDVVPGVHGEGEEVYATSVEDVRNKLTQLAEQIENYELGIESPSVVKETIKGLESELVVCKRDIAVERSSRCMFVSRIENCGITPMTGEGVLALLNDCDMLASREFDIPSRLEITYGDAAIDAATGTS